MQKNDFVLWDFFINDVKEKYGIIVANQCILQYDRLYPSDELNHLAILNNVLNGEKQ